MPTSSLNADVSAARRRSPSHKTGRLLLFGMLLLVLSTNAAIFRRAAHASLEAPIRGATVDVSVWILALAGGLWFRKKAARPMLAGLLLLSAAAQGLFLPEAVSTGRVFVAVTVSIHLLSAIALTLLPPLRRLTSRSRLFLDWNVPVFSPSYLCLFR